MAARVPAYAAPSAKAPLVPHEITRRETGPHDVRIEILFCGVCHSDIHQVRDEWGGSIFPMVPGHEIVGRVTQVGDRRHEVQGRRPRGRRLLRRLLPRRATPAGGTSSSSARRDAPSPTTGPRWTGRRRPTAATPREIVVNERFTLKVPAGLDLSAAAPAPLRGDHHVLAAPAVEVQAGRPRRRGGPRRARPHGGEAGRGHGGRGDDAQHVEGEGGRRAAARRPRLRADERRRRRSRSSRDGSTS